TWCCGRHTRDMIYSDQKCVKRFFRDISKLLKRILQDESYDVYIDAALFASAMLKVLSKLADAEENMDLGASFMENSR
ncbi:Hypothetical predicted protein, partial [Mytilus galloprovincialis]